MSGPVTYKGPASPRTAQRSPVNMAAIVPEGRSPRGNGSASGPRNGNTATRSMPAVGASSRAARMARVRSAIVMSAAVIGVTVAGAIVGAYGVAPLVASRDAAARAAAPLLRSMSEIGAMPQVQLAAAAAAVLIVVVSLAMAVVRSRRTRARGRASSAMPAATSRTPRDIEALAAKGTNPVEIAIRTRMSVDAVAMLMSLGRVPESAAR